MNSKALYLSLQQALRSIALTFFPATFITLTIWATSGSVSGNTADPLRGAVWFWLGMHLVGFHLSLSATQAGSLTYLPILAGIFPIIALRSGVRRLKIMNGNDAKTYFWFLFWYLVTGEIFALVSQNHIVKPILWEVPINFLGAFLIALIYSPQHLRNKKNTFQLRTHSIFALTAFWIGVALLVESAVIFTHLTTVENLTTVIAPGIVGGITLWLLQLLYLPNLLLSAFSYLLGIGYSVGVGTKITPTFFKISDLPSIPLLGTLPTGKHPLAYLVTGVIAISYFIWQILQFRSAAKLSNAFSKTLSSEFILVFAIFILSIFNHGELISPAEKNFGSNWWQPTVFFGGFLLISNLLTLGVIAVIRKIKSNQKSVENAA